MTETDLDRRLRAWMAEREPGHVPAALRSSAARVPYETPIPIASRIHDVLVRSGDGRAGVGLSPVAIALLLLAALVTAMLASVLVGGTIRPAPPEPDVTRWGAFAVGEPAPATVMVAMPGAAQLSDDASVEFEDFVGSVVTILVPRTGGDPAADDLATFAAARARTGDDVLFFVGARSPAVLDAFAPEGGALALGIGAIDLANGGRWAAAFPDGRDALVVVDRGGTVAAVFIDTVPGEADLVELLDRLEVDR